MIEIVVIDEDQSVSRSTTTVLRDGGYVVLELSSSRNTLYEISTLTPDLVVTELVMSEVEGLDLIQHLRRMTPQPRIIAV